MNLQVVIHAVDAASLRRARANAKNLIAEAPDARIEIVVNAEAVEAALDEPPDFGVLPAEVCLILCANTLRRLGRAKPEGMAEVPAAILHLVERQRDGWAYVRA